MLRIAVPYGELSSRAAAPRWRASRASSTAATATSRRARTCSSTGSRCTRAADVMDLLAAVDMHGIQTSGNCIRNITSDALAGIAPDEVVDPRPYCEILRQWSTLHPEFAFLPRKFKIAVSGAREDRAAIGWHDIGLQLQARTTPARSASRSSSAAAWAARRSSARWISELRAVAADPRLHRGHRARLQPLRPPRQRLQGAHQDPGQGRGRRSSSTPSTPSSRAILERDVDGARHIITQAELDRVAASLRRAGRRAGRAPSRRPRGRRARRAFTRWLERNVHGTASPATAR